MSMMLKRFLTEDEQRRLLAAARAHASPLAQRDYHMLCLLIETGMRVQEFTLISHAEAVAALGTGWLVMPAAKRKGGRQSHAYLVTEPVRQSLVALLGLHGALRPTEGVPDTLQALPLVWGRCQGTESLHISVRSVQNRLKVWAGLAGLPAEVSPHWLRHSRGVNIINRSRGNNPLKVAQLALGHASIASTGIYTQMTRAEYERELHAVARGRMRKADALALGARL